MGVPVSSLGYPLAAGTASGHLFCTLRHSQRPISAVRGDAPAVGGASALDRRAAAQLGRSLVPADRPRGLWRGDAEREGRLLAAPAGVDARWARAHGLDRRYRRLSGGQLRLSGCVAGSLSPHQSRLRQSGAGAASHLGSGALSDGALLLCRLHGVALSTPVSWGALSLAARSSLAGRAR